jgi:hypothetical protein
MKNRSLALGVMLIDIRADRAFSKTIGEGVFR